MLPHMNKQNYNDLTGIKEIARRANVAIATVDRVIHNRTGVSVKTRNKINEIISELNYQPNLNASRLASRKIIKIATIIPKRSDETSFWEAPLKGIEQAENEINQFGVVVEKYFYDQDIRVSFNTQVKTILKSHPDGVLLAPSFIEESLIFVNKCKKINLPYVLIDSDLPDQKSLCYIGPDLFQSGYLGGHLSSYLMNGKGKILLLNISKEIDNHHHLLRKEEGFKSFFKDQGKTTDILKMDIKNTDWKVIHKRLDTLFNNNKDIKVIFVTNSRVSGIAQYVKDRQLNLILIGYDCTDENIAFLKSGIIDFLICQKPREQAYRGIKNLYQHLAFSKAVEEIYFMPIDILTKENIPFYRN
jgi:LacI family transcriptional regulator